MWREGICIEEVMKEVAWCMTYDQADTCRGASGRKLRQVCIWCPKFWRGRGIEMGEEINMIGEAGTFEKLGDAIEVIRKDVSQMAKSIAVMEVKLESVSKDVDEMKQTPKKRWDSVVAALIGTGAGAFVAWIINKSIT